MDIVNVGAGRTDEEYNEAEQRHRDELREDSQTDATYFFYAAGLAATCSGILPVRINFLINVGLFDLLRLYGGASARATLSSPRAPPSCGSQSYARWDLLLAKVIDGPSFSASLSTA
jgi:hypothetical protein